MDLVGDLSFMSGGSAIGIIGVILIILTAIEGGAVWENSNGHIGILLFFIGMILIPIFANKTKSLVK